MWEVVVLQCGPHTCTTIHVLNVLHNFFYQWLSTLRILHFGSLGNWSETVVACILANGWCLVRSCEKDTSKLPWAACKSLCVYTRVPHPCFIVVFSWLLNMPSQFEHDAVDYGINSKSNKTTHISMNQFVTYVEYMWSFTKSLKMHQTHLYQDQPSSHPWTMACLGKIFTWPQAKTSVFKRSANKVGGVKFLSIVITYP